MYIVWDIFKNGENVKMRAWSCKQVHEMALQKYLNDS